MVFWEVQCKTMQELAKKMKISTKIHQKCGRMDKASHFSPIKQAIQGIFGHSPSLICSQSQKTKRKLLLFATLQTKSFQGRKFIKHKRTRYPAQPSLSGCVKLSSFAIVDVIFTSHQRFFATIDLVLLVFKQAADKHFARRSVDLGTWNLFFFTDQQSAEIPWIGVRFPTPISEKHRSLFGHPTPIRQKWHRSSADQRSF